METDEGGIPKRRLTVCAYLAVDNGKYLPSLIEEVLRDKAEMIEAGATSDMAVCIQIDTGEGNRCILATSPGVPPEQSLYIGPVNMGDPDTLMAFLDWCRLTRPAERYVLIIGSHGSGPKADPIYEGRNVRSATVAENAQVDAPRAIAFDDQSKSFLSLPDLRRALAYGVERMGGTFAVVLLDACYMATYEVLHELQGLTDYVVATPEAMPGEGMPYTALLERWATEMRLGPAFSLGSHAVNAFRASYQDTNETVSLMACDMAKVAPLVSAMGALGTALASLLDVGCARPMIAEALDRTIRASDPDFAYLQDLALYLRRVGATVDVPCMDVAETTIHAVAAWWGHSNDLDWGPTVYLPLGHAPGWYKDLAVAKTPWGKWVMEWCG